ncbi:MAG TPA: hypothetical protein VET48_13560, partial [Steroidobacteraceae bacterium]|nr:hypothetical protein [Steroidobacteraceae bacterium]
ALLRWQGSDWIFVETEPNTFERRIVHPAQWLDDGVLVQDDLSPEQKIVTTGAMLLLGMEGESKSEKSEKD